MSKAITRAVEVIADDAIDVLGCGKEQSAWLSALMVAIRLDYKHNQGLNVADLASLGQYLADDCKNHLGEQEIRLRGELETVGGEA